MSTDPRRNTSGDRPCSCRPVPGWHGIRQWLALGMVALGISATASASGTWTALTNSAPGAVALMLLLPDGTVMAHNNEGTAWYRLTPDSHGHFINGTWSTMAPMHDTRLYFSSDVLIDGRVFVAGGEDGIGGRTAEVYDPLTNAWTMTPYPNQGFFDSVSKLLPNGKVLVAPVSPVPSGFTALYDPATNTWAQGPKLFRGSSQDEASWVQLPDDSIITIDPFGTNSERYIPSSNTWIDDATVPVTMYNTIQELGAGLLLPDGRAFFLGGTGHTALYSPSGTTNPGAWTAGPDIPDGHGTSDAAAAMMPNGKILCVAGSATSLGGLAFFYEYDPVANSFAAVTAPGGGQTDHIPPYESNMLDLPDGTVLYSDISSRLYVYTPDGAPLAAGKPTIAGITQNADASFHLTGTLLNGISEGAAYGDDAQPASNYPIVRLTAADGTVYGARTFGRSTTSIMTGGAVLSTEFYPPPGIAAGTYSVTVSANGISSDPYPLSLALMVVTLPASVSEGSAPVTGTVTLPSAPAADTVVSLASSLPARATVPASVIVPAGQTSASFTVTIVDDSLFNGTQAVIISATAGGYQGGAGSMAVQDNEFATLTVTPASDYNPTGSYGGPFTPSSMTYTLTNMGSKPITWSASKTFSWFDLSHTGGNILPGGQVTVTASLNSTANTLPPATYSDTIAILNQTNGDGDVAHAVSFAIIPSVPVVAALPAFSKGFSTTVTWAAPVGSFLSYDCQMSTNPSFATVLSTQSPSATSATFFNVNDGTLYYYRVRSKLGTTMSAWSNPVSSTQDQTAPSVAIKSPVPGPGYFTTHDHLVVQGTASDVSGISAVTVGGQNATTSDGFAHWSAAVPLATGTNSLVATAVDGALPGGNSTASSNFAVVRSPSTQGDGLPDAWKTAHGLDPASSAVLDGPSGNPDGDTLPNLLEYAFNADPQAASLAPVQFSLQTNPGDGLLYPVISYPQLLGALDLSYAVEISTDLAAWSSPPSQIQQLSATTDPGSATQTVVVRIKPAVTTGQQRFVRVRVTAQ